MISFSSSQYLKRFFCKREKIWLFEIPPITFFFFSLHILKPHAQTRPGLSASRVGCQCGTGNLLLEDVQLKPETARLRREVTLDFCAKVSTVRLLRLRDSIFSQQRGRHLRTPSHGQQLQITKLSLHQSLFIQLCFQACVFLAVLPPNTFSTLASFSIIIIFVLPNERTGVLCAFFFFIFFGGRGGGERGISVFSFAGVSILRISRWSNDPVNSRPLGHRGYCCGVVPEKVDMFPPLAQTSESVVRRGSIWVACVRLSGSVCV